ncbi:MAG: bifunctional diaminohydroxyphosphoribosylaminopyrimidine deaminase/5-amino-6-(5-phosphoribosylamino)uracil reductase RibD [Nitriliruptor sp.]|nr:MAG: bifunctional diaminohydroxyphosphoribosylaminopyrimidine deaminase/5-amino-6-(5-phosphoribosylamino)uracil reductase RibD [Nitriliruptor sp.]
MSGPLPSALERAALARAWAVAAPHGPAVSPNPAVGCILLADGRVVAEGVTQPPPGPHAEVVALRAAGAAARGATAVVTLEPCAHHGRTPPCTEALIAAGVTRVVLAHPDPNPAATGGAARLRQAGVEVVGPLAAGDLLRGGVAGALEGFLSTVLRGRPHVTLKLARTADGQVTNPSGARWVTGALARRAVHRWRAAVDGVLVGIGTVLADDPRLDVRDVDTDRQPRAVVLDAQVRTPPTAQLVRPGTVVIAAAPAGAGPTVAQGRRADQLVARGVEVAWVPPAADRRGVDLPAALARLAELGIVSLLAEPGPTLAGALLDAALVDRLVLHVAVGLGDGPLAAALAPPPGAPWRTERSGGAGPDAIVHLLPPRTPL